MQKDERSGSVAYREGMTRREVFASAAVVGAGIILSPALGSVRHAGAAEVAAGASRTQGIFTKTIPRTNESLPAIGLGTYLTFDVIPGEPRDFIREVIRRFREGGGRVVDTSPLYGTGEISVGDFATAMGIAGELFITNKVWSTGKFLADDSHALASLEQSMQRLWRDKIDVMQVHSLVNVDQIVPILRGWKQEGIVRYIGVTHHELPYFGPLAGWVEKGNLDFVQVHYSIHTRNAEERILPAAADNGVAVMVNMPFEKARLFKVVEGHPLPNFAKEIGASNWAQFFLKWVISHPALTHVRQPFRVRLRADEDEERRGGTRFPKPPFPVGDREPLKLAVAVAFDGFRPQAHLDVRPGANLAHQEDHAPREPREMDDALSGRVPRAGYEDVLPLDEAHIARDDIENSGPREALEFRDAQAAAGRSGSDEHALRDDLRPVRQRHDAIRPPGLEPSRLAREDVLRPEEPGLLVRALSQLGAADAARETEVVPDQRAGAGLPAYRFTLDDSPLFDPAVLRDNGIF